MSDFQKRQPVRHGIQQRDGFLSRAMQRAGIDDARAALAVIEADVGVALQEIVMSLRDEKTLPQKGIVPVQNGKSLSGEFEVAKLAMARYADHAGVAFKSIAVPVGVAEDKRRLEPRQLIENSLAAHVAAVNEVFGAALLQQRDRRGGDLDVVVRVAENSDEHGV